MTAVDQRPGLAVNSSFRNASHLVGTLDADGTAVVQQDLASLKTSNGDGASHLKNNTSQHSISSTSSDGDRLDPDPSLVVEGSRGGGLNGEGKLHNARYESLKSEDEVVGAGRGRPQRTRRRSITVKLEKTGETGKYYLSSDNPELRALLQNTFERTAEGNSGKKRSKFSDIVFTRQFTTFDRQNVDSAKSPFHGFFTLFWMGVALLLVQIAANNWRHEGSIFGKNEIVQMMVKRDLLLLGITDGVMCGITVVSLAIQKLVFHGWLNWDRSGWIIQNVWQTIYLASFIGWTRYREWPWTHSILIVLHAIAMLMKQHSFAFYNGHLSEVYKRRDVLKEKLRHLEDSDVFDNTSPTRSPERASATSFLDEGDLAMLNRRRKSMQEATKESHDLDEDISNVRNAINDSADPLSLIQTKSLRRVMKWEIDRLSEELRGKCTVTENHYPRNLNWKDFYGYIPLPTVVYELEYPRQETINWTYVFEKTLATFGIIGVMIMISTAFIYPVVVHTVQLKEQGIPLRERLIHDFPWVFMDLLFPLLMEQLLSWYLIWECVLNVLAELTRFADRGFYADWWNSTSWDYYARAWNIPVHNFLLRHAYHSSISAFHLSRSSATLLTFFLSACVHELVMMVLFGKVRGYLFLFQMLQLPLVALSRSRLLKGRDTLGNVVFWLGLSAGPSFLTSMYLFV